MPADAAAGRRQRTRPRAAAVGAAAGPAAADAGQDVRASAPPPESAGANLCAQMQRAPICCCINVVSQLRKSRSANKRRFAASQTSFRNRVNVAPQTNADLLQFSRGAPSTPPLGFAFPQVTASLRLGYFGRRAKTAANRRLFLSPARGDPIRRAHETPRPYAGRRPVRGESRSRLVQPSASSQATKAVPCLSAHIKILTRRDVMAPLRTQTRKDVMALWRTQTKRLFVGLAHGRKKRPERDAPASMAYGYLRQDVIACDGSHACSGTLRWNPAVGLAVELYGRA